MKVTAIQNSLSIFGPPCDPLLTADCCEVSQWRECLCRLNMLSRHFIAIHVYREMYVSYATLVD